MKYFACACLVSACLSLFAQDNPLSNFKGIKSQGQIPADFTTSWADKYYEKQENLDREDIELGIVSMEDFWIDQNHAIDLLLSSGKFSFGDPLTLYINEVADKVLIQHPELRSKLRFYLYRDPSANAFCVADGLIGINCGLLANIKSEAELAFVIAHESAHYQEEHVFEDYFSIEDELSELNALESVENRIKRSRDQELDADAEGLDLYLSSGYDTAAISFSLITLYESYHPAGRCSISGNPFAYKNNYLLPEWSVKAHNQKIADDYDYLDLDHGHPNVAERISQVRAMLKKDSTIKAGARFLIGQSRFNEIQLLAQFENIRLNILKANYSAALYEVACQLSRFPDNEFLLVSKLRALYGLAAFKARDRYFQVAPIPFRVPGPVRDLNYSLFQFNKYDITAVAIRFANDIIEIIPGNPEILSMQRNLHRMFYGHFFLENPKKPLALENEIPERSRKFLNDILPNLGLEGEVYSQNFESDWVYMDSIKNYIPAMVFYEPDIAWEDYIENTKGFVLGANYNGLYVVDPFVFVDPNRADTQDKINSLECVDRLMFDFPEKFEAWGFQGKTLHSYFYDSLGTEGYNQLADIKMLISEARVFAKLDFGTARDNVMEDLGLAYPYAVSIFGLIRATGSDYYYFNVIDLRTGRYLAQDIADEGDALLPVDFERSTERNFKALRN